MTKEQLIAAAQVLHFEKQRLEHQRDSINRQIGAMNESISTMIGKLGYFTFGGDFIAFTYDEHGEDVRSRPASRGMDAGISALGGGYTSK